MLAISPSSVIEVKTPLEFCRKKLLKTMTRFEYLVVHLLPYQGRQVGSRMRKDVFMDLRKGVKGTRFEI